MIPVPPRIVNNVSYVTRSESFCMAGTALGDVGVSLFVAGTVFGEIWIDSRSAKRRNFQYKMRLQSAKSNLGKWAGAR